MNKRKSIFLSSLSGEITDQVPVWLMRQAGRYLPEYRALRAEAGSFLDLCFNPAFATEVTLQPIRRFDMDAAILFSDILVVPYALGQDLKFVEGEGPRLGRFDLSLLTDHDFHQKLAPVYETVRRVRATLDETKALIGFAGAPWTIACYMIHGRGGEGFTKVFDYAESNPVEFAQLLDLVATKTAEYLCRQIEAGADAVQIFDSWAGLCEDDGLFIKAIIEPTKKIVSLVKEKHPEIKIIGFPRGAEKFYQSYASLTGVDAVGVDQDADLSLVPKDICAQGNLSPETLLEGGDKLNTETLRILNANKNRPFIFNLGHGVIKETPPEHVGQLIQLIKEFKRA